jgi:hypothetical protein
MKTKRIVVESKEPQRVQGRWQRRTKTLAAFVMEWIALGVILVGMGHAPVFLGYYAMVHVSRGNLPPEYTASIVWMPLAALVAVVMALVLRSEVWRSRMHVLQACIMLAAGWWTVRRQVDLFTIDGWRDLTTITAIPLTLCCGVGIVTGIVREVRWHKAKGCRPGM